MAKEKKDKAMVLKLRFSDRAQFGVMYPQGTDILTAIILRDIKSKLELSQPEQDRFDIKRNKDDQLEWKNENNKVKSISFTKPEIKFLKDRVTELDKQKKIPLYLLDVVLQIQDVKLDKE